MQVEDAGFRSEMSGQPLGLERQNRGARVGDAGLRRSMSGTSTQSAST